MMIVTVTGHTRTEAKLETLYDPFDRVDIPYSDSPPTKEVTPYHSFNGMDIADNYPQPYSHLNHNNYMPHFWNDMDDDIPMRP
jgi:hypothetical protein